MTIFTWDQLSKDFTDGLILGNGASIAFDPRFRYSSLLARAQENETISDDVQKVFSHLHTADFELVLRMLWHSNMINNALEIDDDRTKAAYIGVRSALVEIVRDIHVTHEEVEEDLVLASEFMRQFSTVVSLSYDVLVYWALLIGNDNSQIHQYKDCFVNGRFREDWQELRNNIPPCQSTTLVVYPHGNLSIGVDLYGSEFKIRSNPYEPLLETVFERWTSEHLAPVFVSEGTTNQKLASIYRSMYLSTVYHQILPDITDSIVLFGWSVNDNDTHILNAISKGRPRRIAFAINPESSTIDIQVARVDHLLSQYYNNSPYELILFDRRSSGCWINP